MHCFACGARLPDDGEQPCPRCGAVRCPRCHEPVAQGQYCPRCGYPVSPDIHVELSHLQYILKDLDAALAAGETTVSLTALRERYMVRFNQLYTGGADPNPRPSLPARTEATGPAGKAITRPLAMSPWIDQAVAPPGALAVPRRPFSLGGLLADQAITLISYLGGFLLLVATLLFVLYGWDVLSEGAKLGAVIAVHLFFGSAGLWLRKMPRLQVVSRVYGGVYALSLPLVGLAVYRFALRGIDFAISGALCIVAIYAAVAYLALGARLRVNLYAALGLSAVALAMVAGLAWAGLGAWWWPVGLAAAALGYLALGAFPQVVTVVPAMVARLLAVIALIGAELWAVATALAGAIRAVNTLEAQPADLNLALLAATALLIAWGLVWWGQQRRPRRLALPALFLIQLVLAALAQAQASFIAYAYALLALGICYIMAARLAEQLDFFLSAFPRWVIEAMERHFTRSGPASTQQSGPSGTFRQISGLTAFLDGAGLLLVLAAAGPALAGPIYNPPLVAILSVGVLLSLGITLVRRAPWLALVVGLFAGLDLAACAPYLVGPDLTAATIEPLYLGATLLTVACGLTAGRIRGRRWGVPLYLTGLAFLIVTYLFSLFASPASTALVLLISAGAGYVLAASTEVWALPVVYLLVLIGIPYLGAAARWPAWLDLAALGTLAAVLAGLQGVWGDLAGLVSVSVAAVPAENARLRSTLLSAQGGEDQGQRLAPTTIGAVGAAMHRWASVGVAVIGALVAIVAPAGLTPQAPLTLAGALLLIEAAVLLALAVWQEHHTAGLYVAGLLAALAASWLARYWGLFNVQAYILVPGAYLVFAGAMLSGHSGQSSREMVWIGQGVAIVGALLLTLTTLAQSFGEMPWLYAGVLAAEASVLVVIGLSARQRLVTLVGAGLVGVTALRGLFIVAGTVPVWATFALLSLLLLASGGALSWWRGHPRVRS
jgi:predicted RNA-binding Zn-ribbon protein involved in translation (DUF1610 family)